MAGATPRSPPTPASGNSPVSTPPHRAHARAEDRIRYAKDTGLDHFQSGSFAINQAWLSVVMLAIDLIAWTQHLLLHGHLAKAEPKTLRYRLLHVAARLTRGQRRLWATDPTHLALGPRPRRRVRPPRGTTRPSWLIFDPDTTSGGSYRQNQHTGRHHHAQLQERHQRGRQARSQDRSTTLMNDRG
jgi:hypothetical protein